MLSPVILRRQSPDPAYVIKTAGSDVGRLWHQRHFRKNSTIFFSAVPPVVIASRSLGRRLAELGVERKRIVLGGGAYVPLDEFNPRGAQLQLAEFIEGSDVNVPVNRAIIGMYGKLGSVRVFCITSCPATLHRQGRAGPPCRNGPGAPTRSQGISRHHWKLALQDHVTQLPFLPHWRVPEFLRMCSLVCCLEQDFPIRAHAPIIAQEAMATGVCTLLSQEIAAKQPDSHLLVHGFNCLIVAMPPTMTKSPGASSAHHVTRGIGDRRAGM